MPFTITLFAWRKLGTSPAEFKHHWDNVHVPILQSIAGDKFPTTHTRYYIQRNPADDAAVTFVGKSSNFGDYDGFAVLEFEDAGRFQEFFAAVSEPEAAARIKEDEEQFLNRAKMTVVPIDHVSVASR